MRAILAQHMRLLQSLPGGAHRSSAIVQHLPGVLLQSVCESSWACYPVLSYTCLASRLVISHVIVKLIFMQQAGAIMMIMLPTHTCRVMFVLFAALHVRVVYLRSNGGRRMRCSTLPAASSCCPCSADAVSLPCSCLLCCAFLQASVAAKGNKPIGRPGAPV